MPFIKVTYSSSNNISVQGSDYFEVGPEELDENGNVPQAVVDRTWQDAVNEFMGDTYAEVMEEEAPDA